MIVASNGMLTGGRVVGHLRNLIGDPDATILFVGYQGEGTLGAHLQAGANEVKIDGQPREVRCQIRSISGFSAHADENELLDWLANFARGKKPGDPRLPATVFLVHGDPEAQIAIEPKVRALGFEPKIPHWRERVTLERSSGPHGRSLPRNPGCTIRRNAERQWNPAPGRIRPRGQGCSSARRRRVRRAGVRLSRVPRRDRSV